MAPTWAEHADIIVPGIMNAMKLLIAVISVIGGALCSIIVWIGKQMASKVNSMDSKLDNMQSIMMACDGCSEAARKYGRRRDDFNFEDGSD